MRRFTWQEMKKYWEVHFSSRAQIDYDHDTDGLGNVCLAGAPLWLNQYYANFQKTVYQKLVALLPLPTTRVRALDVGCGAGRWCRLLAGKGYDTVGIDLQAELIEMNRRRNPNIDFFCTSIRDFSAEDAFDLISSVTVIQHIPFEEQDVVIQKLRELLKTNGYAIILENIRDQGIHVFSNTIKGWQAKFEKAGFQSIAIQRYEYSPFLRLHSCTIKKLKYIVVPGDSKQTELTPERYMISIDDEEQQDGLKNSLHSINNIAKRLSVGLDSIVEPLFIRSNINLPTVHCGFLFKAV